MFCKIKQQDLPYPISIILNFNLPILLCRGIRFITLSKRLPFPTSFPSHNHTITLCRTFVEPASLDDMDVSFVEAFRCDIREGDAWGDENCVLA